jgi:hypothetical protein
MDWDSFRLYRLTLYLLGGSHCAMSAFATRKGDTELVSEGNGYSNALVVWTRALLYIGRQIEFRFRENG